MRRRNGGNRSRTGICRVVGRHIFRVLPIITPKLDGQGRMRARTDKLASLPGLLDIPAIRVEYLDLHAQGLALHF